MAAERFAQAGSGLRSLFEGDGVLGHSERQLLDRFVTGRDERAFEAIVQRHGPMVAGVCRAVLADPTDADDAFQATFLVLARKAGSLRNPDRLSPWLHGVARRVALRARADSAKRRGRETPCTALVAAAPDRPGRSAEACELATLLHAELDRLSPPERSAVLLCDLEGMSHQEAADQLGWPLSTVKTRITRGRDRLRARLTRRGVTLSATALASTLAEQAVAAVVVPRVLVAATARAAVALAAGPTLAVGLSPSISSLTPGAARTMILGKLKALTLGLAATTTAVVVPGVIARQAQPARPAPAAPGVVAVGGEGEADLSVAAQAPTTPGPVTPIPDQTNPSAPDAPPTQPIPAPAENLAPAPPVTLAEAALPTEVPASLLPPAQEPPPPAVAQEAPPQPNPGGQPPPGQVFDVEKQQRDVAMGQRGVLILQRLEQPLPIPDLLDHFENPDHPTFFGLTRIITRLTRDEQPEGGLPEGIPIDFTPEARKVARRKPVNVARWEPKDGIEGPNLRTKLTREASQAGLAYVINFQEGKLVFDLIPDGDAADPTPAGNDDPFSQPPPTLTNLAARVAGAPPTPDSGQPPVPNGRSPFKSDPSTPAAAPDGFRGLGAVPQAPSPRVAVAPPPAATNEPASVDAAPPISTEPAPANQPRAADAPPLPSPVAIDGVPVERAGAQRRQLQDQERNEAILAELDKVVSLKFAEKASLNDLLAFIRKEARGPNGKPIPIYLDPQLNANMGVSFNAGDPLITIDLDDIPLRTGLRLALKQVGLSYTVSGGLLIISSDTSISGFADPGRNPMGGMGGQGGMM